MNFGVCVGRTTLTANCSSASQCGKSTSITQPKTKKSKAPIPVIPELTQVIEAHRIRTGNPTAGLVFPSGGKQPLDPNNVLGRTILPVLNRCATCHQPKGECDTKTAHRYERDSSLPEWHGWHAFRRGLATNLHDLGIDDKTIQAILRHSNVKTTQECYIKTMPKQTVEAMAKLNDKITPMFSGLFPDQEVPGSKVVN